MSNQTPYDDNPPEEVDRPTSAPSIPEPADVETDDRDVNDPSTRPEQDTGSDLASAATGAEVGPGGTGDLTDSGTGRGGDDDRVM